MLMWFLDLPKGESGVQIDSRDNRVMAEVIAPVLDDDAGRFHTLWMKVLRPVIRRRRWLRWITTKAEAPMMMPQSTARLNQRATTGRGMGVVIGLGGGR